MANNSVRSSRSASAELPQSLVERVQARVADALISVNGPGKVPRSSSKRSRRPRVQTLASPKGAGLTPEVRSLRRVFHELGQTHREYRRRTGVRVQPELREAAMAFKKTPSIASLVIVAAFLEELGLLAW